MPPDYLTTEDVARLAGVSPNNILKLRSRGAMPAGTRMGWQWVWHEDEIKEWVKTRPSRGPRPRERWSPPPGQPWTIGAKTGGTPRAFHIAIDQEGGEYVTACGYRGPLRGVESDMDLSALTKRYPLPICSLCANEVKR